MKMDISSEFVTDMVLVIIGYAAAGALSIVIHSAITGRRLAHRRATDRGHAARQPQVVLASPDAPSRTHFVQFGQPVDQPVEVPGERSVRSERIDAHTRSRPEIIRIAREMVKAGAAHDRIQRVLPISETELALLSHGRN